MSRDRYLSEDASEQRSSTPRSRSRPGRRGPGERGQQGRCGQSSVSGFTVWRVSLDLVDCEERCKQLSSTWSRQRLRQRPKPCAGLCPRAVAKSGPNRCISFLKPSVGGSISSRGHAGQVLSILPGCRGGGFGVRRRLTACLRCKRTAVRRILLYRGWQVRFLPRARATSGSPARTVSIGSSCSRVAVLQQAIGAHAVSIEMRYAARAALAHPSPANTAHVPCGRTGLSAMRM